MNMKMQKFGSFEIWKNKRSQTERNQTLKETRLEETGLEETED